MPLRPCPLIAGALLLISANAQSPDNGKRQYEARCVGCHGADGTGGGHGPAIVNLPQPRANSLEDVRDIIRKGIPDKGMPPFPLADLEVAEIAAHVLRLRNSPTDGAAAAPGDPAAGERFFNTKGNCTACHMIQGRGGILGPDLTAIGRDRRPAQIAQILRDPATAARSRSSQAVTVKLTSGQTLHGIAKNESPFDLQLLGIDQKLHLLSKTGIAEITRERSLMPKVDASETELRDLVAYLSRLAPDPNAKSVTTRGDLRPGISFSSIVQPSPGTWPTYNGSLTGNRFSPLDQITAANVANLVPQWLFMVPDTPRPLQGTPVVVDGLMYVTAVNAAYALDARNGREIWRYNRPRTKNMVGDAASGINRGVAVLGDRVFMVSDNAHLFALHRLTGQLLWDIEMADSRQNYGSTGAPLVVNDLVIAGVSGGDEGVRGFLDAYKASTGERVWRFWTIPARGETGSETWGGRDLEHGCGTTWLTGSFDAESNLVYWPTGNPCRDYNGDERKGDNLYTASVVALDPATGKLKWHYQFTPHDVHDWDATETLVLVDAQFQGQPRKLLLQGNRNGFFYVLDRLSGKVLLAEPFVKQLNWASGIGPDGRPKLLPGNEPTAEGQLGCPAVAGAANWPSSAYHPAMGLFYLFAEESCNIYSKSDQQWEAGKSFYGGGTRRAPTSTNEGKSLKAINIQTGKVAWEVPDIRGGILGSGLIATAGNLLFYGDGDGALIAADAATGKLLWHFNVGQSAKSGPMTYQLEGKQYIAQAAGNSILTFALH